jgi:hypothetical protein
LVVTRETVNAARQDPKFDRDVLAAVLDCRSRAAAQIVRAGNNHWRAAAWLLTGRARKRPPGRPRELRSLLLDKRLHSQIKELIRAVLDELLPGDPASLADTVQTALRTPLSPAMMHLLTDRERVLAKAVTLIHSVSEAQAARAGTHTHQSTCAQNVRKLPTPATTGVHQPDAPPDVAASRQQTLGGVI